MKLIIKKSRITTGVVFIIILFFQWALFAFNYVNNDRINYMNLYNSKGFDAGVELGYQVVTHFFSHFMDFDGFQIALAMFVTFSVGKILWENSNSPVFSLVLYTLFPYVLDTVQYRNTIVFCIINFAFLLLYKYRDSNKKKGMFWFIFLVLLASLFHKVSFFYLIYLILYLPVGKIRKIVITCAAIEIGIVLFFPTFILKIIGVSDKAMLVYGNKGFMTATYTRFLFVIFILVLPAMFLILTKEKHLNCEVAHLFEYCKWISFISILWYPILIINVDFFRIYRNIIPLMEIGVVNGIFVLEKRYERMIWKAVLLIFNFLLAYAFIYAFSNNLHNLMYNRLFERF